MKKILSISLMALILISVIGVKINAHYCGGIFSAAKISFDGKRATCGMESGNEDQNSPGITYRNHCCDDRLISLSISDFYDISHFDIKLSDHNIFSHLNIHLPLVAITAMPVIKYSHVQRPPGNHYYSRASGPLLCVFRI